MTGGSVSSGCRVSGDGSRWVSIRGCGVWAPGADGARAEACQFPWVSPGAIHAWPPSGAASESACDTSQTRRRGLTGCLKTSAKRFRRPDGPSRSGVAAGKRWDGALHLGLRAASETPATINRPANPITEPPSHLATFRTAAATSDRRDSSQRHAALEGRLRVGAHAAEGSAVHLEVLGAGPDWVLAGSHSGSGRRAGGWLIRASSLVGVARARRSS